MKTGTRVTHVFAPDARGTYLGETTFNGEPAFRVWWDDGMLFDHEKIYKDPSVLVPLDGGAHAQEEEANEYLPHVTEELQYRIDTATPEELADYRATITALLADLEDPSAREWVIAVQHAIDAKEITRNDAGPDRGNHAACGQDDGGRGADRPGEAAHGRTVRGDEGTTSSATGGTPGLPGTDDADLNDADVYPLISDHDPDTKLAERLDDLRRDGQGWAAGLTTEDSLLHARAIARELDRDLLPDRRAYCEGVKTGLEQGYAGLVADAGDEEPITCPTCQGRGVATVVDDDGQHDQPCAVCGGAGAVDPGWFDPDPEPDPARSFSDILIDHHNGFSRAYVAFQASELSGAY